MRKLVFLLFILAACESKPLVYEAEVKQVDEMIAINDSLQTLFDEVDSAKVMAIFPRVDSISSIMSGPGAPQDDKAYWTQTMAVLDFVHRPMRKYLADQSKIRKDLAKSKHQLQALRNSLVDEKIDSLQVNSYLQTETWALQDVALVHRKRVGPTQLALAVWDTAETRYLDLLTKRDSLLQESQD